MTADQEHALRERVTEQARLEQAGDVAGLCGLILPAYRSAVEARANSTASLQTFVGRVRSAELVSFVVERWDSAAERFGGAPAAVVRTQVRYNGSAEPAHYRTIWVRLDDQWYTTATGKFWLG